MNSKIILGMALISASGSNVLLSVPQQQPIPDISVTVENYIPPAMIAQLSKETDVITDGSAESESMKLTIWQRFGIYLITCYFSCHDFWEDKVKPTIIRLIKKKRAAQRKIQRKQNVLCHAQ